MSKSILPVRCRVESGTIFVYPNDRDSVQEIIVNGKLVWADTPAFIDSGAPYYLDGRTNTVTIVWPHVSKTDSGIIPISPGSSPFTRIRDTINRAAGLTVKTLQIFYSRDNIPSRNVSLPR